MGCAFTFHLTVDGFQLYATVGLGEGPSMPVTSYSGGLQYDTNNIHLQINIGCWHSRSN